MRHAGTHRALGNPCFLLTQPLWPLSKMPSRKKGAVMFPKLRFGISPK